MRVLPHDYLRLQAGKPAPLIELEIVPDQRGGAAR